MYANLKAKYKSAAITWAALVACLFSAGSLYLSVSSSLARRDAAAQVHWNSEEPYSVKLGKPQGDQQKATIAIDNGRGGTFNYVMVEPMEFWNESNPGG